MIQQSRLACAALLTLLGACASAGGAGGSTDLLASGLAGFDRAGTANWTFADGVVQASEGPGPAILITKGDYQDFELTLDLYVSVEHNSGIFIRCSDRANLTATNCYEINVYDHRPDQSGRTGGAPGYFKPLAQVDAGGHWNTIIIRAKGPHIFASFNGITTIAANGPLLANGPIAFQWGAGDVKFRNIRIKRLS